MLSRFFRFHVSGDIPNTTYFHIMMEVAKRNSHCEILCFTKKYSFDSEEECREFLELSHDERCQVFNVFDESDNYVVLPGAAYHTYEFAVVGGILTMYDTLALNV